MRAGVSRARLKRHGQTHAAGAVAVLAHHFRVVVEGGFHIRVGQDDGPPAARGEHREARQQKPGLVIVHRYLPSGFRYTMHSRPRPCFTTSSSPPPAIELRATLMLALRCFSNSGCRIFGVGGMRSVLLVNTSRTVNGWP